MTVITASRYNITQSKISQVLGQGNGMFGYGQSVTSVPVNYGQKVSAIDLNNLRLDFLKVKQFQSGLDESSTFLEVLLGQKVQETHYQVYETEIITLEQNRFLAASNQLSTQQVLASLKTDPWTGQIEHSFTVEFQTSNHARHFFNAAGKINISASIESGDSSGVYDGWDILLSDIGSINFSYNSTTADNGNGSAIGFYQLTNIPQQVFTITGAGAYADNTYSVFISCNVADNAAGNAQYIYVSIKLNNAVTDIVSGILTSKVNCVYANSSNVFITLPTFVNTQSL